VEAIKHENTKWKTFVFHLVKLRLFVQAFDDCAVCRCGLPDVRQVKNVQYKRFNDFSFPKPYQTHTSV
jgi:hypothetical protein